MSLELEAARQQLTERVGEWQRHLQEIFGRELTLEVDPVGLPRSATLLSAFASTGLGAMAQALAEASRIPEVRAAFQENVLKVLVRNDDDAPTSRFDFDPSKKLLVVISTGRLERWVDPLALQAFLQNEL